MKTFNYVSPSKIRKYIPERYFSWCGAAPYYIPIFGTFFSRRIKSIIKIVLEIEEKFKIKFKNILEVGCGLGFFSLNYGSINKESEIVGFDLLSEDGIKFVNLLFKKFFINFKVKHRNIEKVPDFPDEKFDLIVALDVLEHVKWTKLAINEIKRLLKKDGKLIISVPIESKLIGLMRRLYFRIKNSHLINDHWQGDIKSYYDFIDQLKKDFKVEYARNYPFTAFPNFFSYDGMFVLSKK